jgi:hypothetical protein
MTKSKEIKAKIDRLSPGAINDLDLFVDSLINRSAIASNRTLKQKWAGGLKGFRKYYSSLELQKKALEWRKG